MEIKKDVDKHFVEIIDYFLNKNSSVWIWLFYFIFKWLLWKYDPKFQGRNFDKEYNTILIIKEIKVKKNKNKKNKTINVTFSQKLFVFTFVFPFVSVSSFFLFSCRMEKTNIKLSSEKVTLMSKFFEKLFSRELCNSNSVCQNTEFPMDIQRRKKRAKIFSFSIPAQILCLFGRNNRFQIKILKLSSWRRA